MRSDTSDATTSDAKDSAELMRLVNGFQLSQAIHVAAVLGIADLLADGPVACSELAGRTASDERALYRLLRALAAAGVFKEEADRRFALTGLGACLKSDAPRPVGPWAALVGRPYFRQAWGGLLDGVRTGGNAFEQVHGMDVWRYRAAHPEESAAFDAAMNALSAQVSRAVLQFYDFTRFGRVLDVGGGQGALLADILAPHPDLRGILFDQPHVVAGAGALLQRAGVADRCEVRGGSFFDGVPRGADACILKAILHDWDDAEAIRILQACHAALPPAGTLLILEQVIAPPNEGLAGKLSDLNMFVLPGGRERTVEEFAAIFAAAGFRLTRTVATGSRISIVEGKLA
jgi:hypothetical protein